MLDAAFALCPGRVVTNDLPGTPSPACPRRTLCRRYTQAPAGPQQRYVLPEVLGDACTLFAPHGADAEASTHV